MPLSAHASWSGYRPIRCSQDTVNPSIMISYIAPECHEFGWPLESDLFGVANRSSTGNLLLVGNYALSILEVTVFCIWYLCISLHIFIQIITLYSELIGLCSSYNASLWSLIGFVLWFGSSVYLRWAETYGLCWNAYSSNRWWSGHCLYILFVRCF